jgi:AAA family ATP:ADP antiporter
MDRSEFGQSRLAKAVLLFTNFFLIIAALYHLKPASRSIFISALSTDQLPYVWIATAVGLGLIISVYHRIVARHSRIHVVLGTCAVIIALLIAFYPGMHEPSRPLAFGFYIFVDMLSVILVEQFWSLTNSVYTSDQGRRWYGLIATGGLVGGVAGGALSSFWIKQTGLQTMELLLVAAAILFLLMMLTLLMGRLGLYTEQAGVRDNGGATNGGWRTILRHRYLFLIALLLLLAQMVEPLVEYQFMKVVESSILEREARTAYLGEFFSVLSAVAIGINLLITPLIHRWFGAVGGLLAQPTAVLVGSLYYMSSSTLAAGALLKIADRGLSYSINRASKELLYVPIQPLLIFQAKAWIDMFGYRLFKVLGSVLILLLTQWLPWTVSAAQLGWLVLGVCGAWWFTLLWLRGEYARVRSVAGEA